MFRKDGNPKKNKKIELNKQSTHHPQKGEKQKHFFSKTIDVKDDVI